MSYSNNLQCSEWFFEVAARMDVAQSHNTTSTYLLEDRHSWPVCQLAGSISYATRLCAIIIS